MLKGVIKQFSVVSLILLGVITWSITMVKSGWLYSFGLGFWGPNGHDGIWHIALANNFAKLSYLNPVFSGFNTQNYHIGFDILLAILNKVTTIPVSYLYFQIIPPILAILIGVLTYWFVKIYTKSNKAALLSTFFVYFGGSMGWILNGGESMFWSQQSVSTLINPPFALSLVFILAGLISLLKNKNFIAIIFFGLLIQIKVYAGILTLGALLVSGNLFVFFGSLIISGAIFLPFNREASSVIQWQPFWFLETMMSYTDRLGWQRFYSAMTTYKMGHIWIKGTLAYGTAFLIFVFGNFWTRLIFLKDIFNKLDKLKIFMLSIIGAGVVIPIFFVQNGTPWNTIQFMYYSLFFASILAGIALSTLNKYLVIIAVLLTIPTTYLTLRDVYIPGRPPAKVSNYEIEALKFLESQPDGVVLTYLYDADKAKEAINNPPRPLYLYESTAYVSAYTKKQLFLEDEVNLNIMGYDWKTRRQGLTNWYSEEDQSKAKDFLDKNNIKYVYWVKPQRALLGESQLGLVEIFNNKEVIIYRYGKNISGN